MPDFVYKFDFDDDSNSPGRYPYLTAPGYTSVLPTTLYTAELGYGFVVAGELVGHSDSLTVSSDSLYRDAIECRAAGDYFRVDVPNGIYFVTVALGQPGYSRWEKVRINGVDYHWATNPAAPPYEVDPNDGSIKVIDALVDPHVISVVAGDAGRAGSYDQIHVIGWNEAPAGQASEFLYIDRTVVSVAEGHVDIEPTATTNNRWLAMVKVERVAPENCEDIKAMGLLMPADINEDCYVNIQDLAELADDWLLCNNPGQSGCLENWY